MGLGCTTGRGGQQTASKLEKHVVHAATNMSSEVSTVVMMHPQTQHTHGAGAEAGAFEPNDVGEKTLLLGAKEFREAPPWNASDGVGASLSGFSSYKS